MNKTWSRGDVIGIASFIIAGLTFLASITVPELRRCLGLDTGTCPFWVSTQVPSENLITGTYYAEGTMYNNFTREVVRVSDRTCIRLIDGPANNYEGHETVVVSSLSWRNGSFYIDATNERILISPMKEPYSREKVQSFSFKKEGERSLWVLTKAQVEKSLEMDDCLASQDKYTNRQLIRYVPGKFKS